MSNFVNVSNRPVSVRQPVLWLLLFFMSRLTVTLDQLSVNLSLSQNTSQSQVVQPNLVVQSAQIPAANTQGVQFTSLRGQ